MRKTLDDYCQSEARYTCTLYAAFISECNNYVMCGNCKNRITKRMRNITFNVLNKECIRCDNCTQLNHILDKDLVGETNE